MFALVDAADLPLVEGYKWMASMGDRAGHLFYAVRSFGPRNGRKTYVRMHRLILGAGPGDMVDHVNRNGLDNRRANLRLCSASQNSTNRDYPRNEFGFRGVSRYAGRFRARVSPGPCRPARTLGYFATPEEAARAYDAAAVARFGPFAQLNFPQETCL